MGLYDEDVHQVYLQNKDKIVWFSETLQTVKLLEFGWIEHVEVLCTLGVSAGQEKIVRLYETPQKAKLLEFSWREHVRNSMMKMNTRCIYRTRKGSKAV